MLLLLIIWHLFFLEKKSTNNVSKATNCEANRRWIHDKNIKYVLIFLLNLVTDNEWNEADDEDGDVEVENNVADGRFNDGNCSWSTTVLKSKNRNPRQTTNDEVEDRRSDPLDTLHSGDSQHAWHA